MGSTTEGADKNFKSDESIKISLIKILHLEKLETRWFKSLSVNSFPFENKK